jgi:sterol desaturase/sphingolipid hydroxylase (fatty acid hydroxylase superfamily)
MDIPALNHWIATLGWLDAAGAVFLLTGSLTAFSLVTGFALERAAVKRGQKVYAVALRPGQLAHEALGTALFHGVFVPIATVVVVRGGIRFSDGWLANVLGYVCGWYGFMSLYYFAHRLMHTRRLRWMHHWHHRSHVTTPLTGISMHPVEALLWTALLLGPSVLLSSLGLLGFYGWLLFFVMFWTGNIVGHANAEIFGLRVTRWMSILFSNPISYHSLHHARYDRHYGFATALMDRLFGTEWNDWAQVHERALHNQPLKSLSERVKSDAPQATTTDAPVQS